MNRSRYSQYVVYDSQSPGGSHPAWEKAIGTYTLRIQLLPSRTFIRGVGYYWQLRPPPNHLGFLDGWSTSFRGAQKALQRAYKKEAVKE